MRPPFILVGHSAGALYSRQFAHDFPELVAGLVLMPLNPDPSTLRPTPSPNDLHPAAHPTLVQVVTDARHSTAPTPEHPTRCSLLATPNSLPLKP